MLEIVKSSIEATRAAIRRRERNAWMTLPQAAALAGVEVAAFVGMLGDLRAAGMITRRLIGFHGSPSSVQVNTSTFVDAWASTIAGGGT